MNKAFDNAFRNFLDSLPEPQRRRYSPCASSQDLLDGLEKLKSLSKKYESIRFSRIVASIQRVNDGFRPYFEAVGLVIQSHPEYAAIFWGSLRLILQLVDNFSGFFDKIIQNLTEIAGALPQYDDIVSLFNEPVSLRVTRHLEEIYANVFAFFEIVAKVFTKSDGRLKRKSTIAWDLMWTPVDVRFKGLLGTLRIHRQLVRDEFSVLKAKVAHTAESAAEHERGLAAEERRRAEIDRKLSAQKLQHIQEIKNLLTEGEKAKRFDDICRWLAPPKCYVDALETSLNLKEEGTCSWILGTPAYQKWLNTESSSPSPSVLGKLCPNVLWVYGSPGTGKTVLASSVIRELQETMSAQPEVAVCYYFFQAEVGNEQNTTTSAAYRAILSQILHLNRDNQQIIDKFTFCNMNSSLQPRASQKELIGLLQLCGQELRRTYIVLDGVDECSDKDGLLGVIANISTFGSIRILLLSRPSVLGLYQKTTDEQRLQVTRAAIHDDIKTYLTSKVSQLIEENYLPNVSLQELVEHLLSGADGMFLWGKLMIKLLRSPVLTPSRRRRMIQDISFPEGLEKMYNRILSLVSESSNLEVEAAKHVFCWLAFAKAPVSVRLLYEAVHKCQLDPSDDITKEVQQFREMISVVCGALVEVSSPTDSIVTHRHSDVHRSLNSIVKFVHMSVKEHFSQTHTTSSTFGGSLLMEHSLANITLAREALTVLMTSKSKTTSRGEGLSAYSTFFWTKHLSDSISRGISRQLAQSDPFRHALQDLISLFSKFLDTPLIITQWIFSYYQFGGSPLHGQLPYEEISKWLEWLQDPSSKAELFKVPHQTLQSCEEFTHDMARLVRQWGSKLETTPDILWDETVSFLNSRFVFNSSLTKVTSLALNKPTGAHQSSRPLGDISVASSNGEINFRLSVWPSKTFEERWATLRAGDSAARVRDACSGWTMKYEVWKIQSKSCVGQIEIPLDEREIWFAMRQLLYEEDNGNWKTAFPMAISGSGHFVALLRTVFSLQYSGKAVVYEKAVLPIDFTEAHRKHWDDDLEYFDPKDRYHSCDPISRRKYVYSITFSPCDQYLLYSDSHFSGISHHYAVFSIIRTPNLGLNKLNYISESDLGLLVKPLQPEFHYTANWVLICSKSLVHIWAFRDASTVLKLEFRQGDTDHPHEMKPSECGKFVVVILKSGKTIVIQLPAEALLDETLSSGKIHMPSSSQPSPISSLESRGTTGISTFGISKGQVISNRSCIIRHTQGSSGHMVSFKSGDRPSIQLTNHTGSNVRSLELLSLPLTQNIGQTTSTALMPQSEDEPLRVIVNSNSRTNYSMNEIDDNPFPALIERKIELITPQEMNGNDKQRAQFGAIRGLYQGPDQSPIALLSSTPSNVAPTSRAIPSLWETLPDVMQKPPEQNKLPEWRDIDDWGPNAIRGDPTLEIRPELVEPPTPMGGYCESSYANFDFGPGNGSPSSKRRRIFNDDT